MVAAFYQNDLVKNRIAGHRIFETRTRWHFHVAHHGVAFDPSCDYDMLSGEWKAVG
jgi:hypothetical protein